MKTILPMILSLPFLLTGCVSPAPTASHLMNLPRTEVFEVTRSAAVPAAVAYRNILQMAQRCWQRPGQVVEADSFSARRSPGRISVSKPAGLANPALTLAAVEVSQESANTTHLVGRSLLATPSRVHDLNNLQIWAETGNATCG